MGCLTDSQRAARIFPDYKNAVTQDYIRCSVSGCQQDYYSSFNNNTAVELSYHFRTISSLAGVESKNTCLLNHSFNLIPWPESINRPLSLLIFIQSEQKRSALRFSCKYK